MQEFSQDSNQSIHVHVSFESKRELIPCVSSGHSYIRKLLQVNGVY